MASIDGRPIVLSASHPLVAHKYRALRIQWRSLLVETFASARSFYHHHAIRRLPRLRSPRRRPGHHPCPMALARSQHPYTFPYGLALRYERHLCI
jgi:hypothetical protein